MEDEDYDSDSTVLLTDYYEQPEKIDAKRRRLSKQGRADKYEEREQDNTASDGASDNMWTNDSQKQNNNVDKNLLLNKYLTGLGEVKIESNDQQIYPVTRRVTKLIPKELKSDNGRNSIRNANLSNNDVICLDTDDEAEVVENEETKKENVIYAGFHEVQTENNNSYKNEKKYGKLKILKPAAINARRATANIFDRSTLVNDCSDSFRVDKNKETTEVTKPSAITARRATTSFEESWVNTKEIKKVTQNHNILSKKRKNESNNMDNEETKEADNTNAINNTNITDQSDNKAVTSGAITADLNNLKSNTNKLFRNEDLVLSEPKRARIETVTKCTPQLQLKSRVIDNIENKENENLNKTHSEKEKAEACNEPKTSLEGFNSKTLGKVAKQESFGSQDGALRREVQCGQASEGRELPGTSKVDKKVTNKSQDKQNKTIMQGNQEISTVQEEETNVVPDGRKICTVQNDPEIYRTQNEELIKESHDKQNKTILQVGQKTSTVQGKQKTNVVPDERNISSVQNFQEIYRARNEEVTNELHDKQNKTIVQSDQEMSTVQDEQEINVVPDEQRISILRKDQEICRARNVEVINESNDKQNKTIVQGEQETSTVQDEQEINVVPDEQRISTLRKDKEICRARNLEVINESNDKQNKTMVQGEQEISTVQDKQETNVVPNEQEISKIQNDQEICRARNVEVINESLDKQYKTILRGGQEMSIAQDMQETNVGSDEKGICRERKEKVISKSQKKQENPKLQNKQGISVVPGEHDICRVRNKQVTNESHEKQKKTEVHGEQKICKAYNEQLINDAHDKQDKHKAQSEQEISTTQDQNVTIETRDRQETSKIPEEQIIHQAYDQQEKEITQDDDMSKIHDMQETSDKVHKADKQAQHIQITNKVYNDQETKKINDEQKTIGLLKEMKKNERNEARRKLSPGGDKMLILKFQVNFFSLVSEYIRKGYPESALVLHSLIQTLKTDANNGIVQTDVKYSCPKCKHVSTYSSRLLNNSDADENIAAEDCQKCSLCQKLTELHISFMKRYLEEVTNALGQTRIKNKENNSQALCNETSSLREVNSNMPATYNPEIIVPKDDDTKITPCKKTSSQTMNAFKEKYKCVLPKPSDVNVVTLSKNEPVITQKRVSSQYVIDSKRKKFITEHDDAHHLTNLNMSTSKENVSSSNINSNFQNNVFNNNQNKIPQLTQANKNPCEGQDKVLQEITPRNDSGINSEKYNGDSNIETVNNFVRKSTNENTPDKLTNNFQTKTTRNKKLPDSGLKSKSNLIAVAPAEECSDQDNNKTMDNFNEVGSEKATSTLDGQKTRRVSHNVNEQAETYKPGDSISDVAPSECLENENYSDPNMENTNSKQNDNSNAITLKSLEDTFTKLRNNANTKQTENKKAKAQQETNTATPVSATNQNNSVDIQPNCNINKRTDVQYICKYCSCEYVQAARLLRHMKTNHNAKDLTVPENCIRRKCVYCNESMHNKNYNKHVKKYHLDKFTKNVAINENSDINEDGSGIMENDRTIPRSNNEMMKTSESSSYKYLCSICEEILPTDYASRQHRKEKHPEYKNQQIYKKVIIKGNNERDDENEELNAEDDMLNTSSQLETENDGEDHTKYNEARSRNEVKYNQEAHNGQSSLTLSKIVGRNENNNMNDGSDHVTTKDALKYKYLCIICNEVLGSYYASRLHRKQKHPEFKYRQIYKKVTLKGKDDDNEELDAEDTSDESEDDGEIVTRAKEVNPNGPTNYKKNQDQTKENRVGSANNANYDQHARADNSGTTSANTNNKNDNESNVTITEASKFKFHCSICDEILNNDYASRQHRKQKHPKLRRRKIYRKVIIKGKEEQDGGELSSSSDSDESSDDDQNLICNDNHQVASSNGKESNQLAHHDSSPSSDHDEIKDDNVKSVPPRHCEKKENNGDEAIQPSDLPIKNKCDRIVKLFGNEKEALAQPDINVEKSNQEDGRNITANSANNSSRIEEASEDESVKVSERTAKNKKERIMKLFGDDTDVSIKTNKTDCDEQVNTYAFLTDDIRRHHEIYHTDNESKQFKIVVFNDKDDESFNSKLFQAKAIVKSEGTQGIADIFKCTCKLCFLSFKNLKLHFAECEYRINNGITCPDCTILRQFLPAELATHRSLHHGAKKYEFKVHRILIQEESNVKSESECNIPDPEIENGALPEIEDLNVHNDFLKDETLTQTSNEDGSQNYPESVERNDNNLAVGRDMTKDESLTQNTNENDCQRYPENLEPIEEDLAVKTEMLKTETKTKTSEQEDSQNNSGSVKINEEDSTIKRQMLKTLTQTSDQEDSQKDQESVKINEEDLAVKRDMLKDETLTQTTNEDFEQRDSESVGYNEENTAFQRNMSKDETLTQTTNENGEQKDLESVDINEGNVAVGRHTLNDNAFIQDTNDSNNQNNSESMEFDEENLDVQRDALNAKTLTEANERDPEFVELSDNEDDVVNKVTNSQEIMDVDDSEPPISIDSDSDSDSDIEVIECSSSLSDTGTLRQY